MMSKSEVNKILDNMCWIDSKDINALLSEQGLGHLRVRKVYGWWEINDTRFAGFPVKHSSVRVCVRMVLSGHRPMPSPAHWDTYKHLVSDEAVVKFNSYNGVKAHVAGHYENGKFVPFVYVK